MEMSRDTESTWFHQRQWNIFANNNWNFSHESWDFSPPTRSWSWRFPKKKNHTVAMGMPYDTQHQSESKNKIWLTNVMGFPAPTPKKKKWFRLPLGLSSKFVRFVRVLPKVNASSLPMTYIILYTKSINLNVVNSKICLQDPTCSGIKSNEHSEHQLWT
jgi:hypothetical protein